MATTIDAQWPAVEAVLFAVFGGTFRLRLTSDDGPGSRHADVLDDAGNVIGSASDYIYGGRGWAVSSRPFAGYVAEHQVEFVA